jgi:hypothetical protein
LHVGAPIGSATLTFSGDASATLDYTLAGKTSRKSVQRQPIASAANPAQGAYAGLWWGGPSQSGWGLSIAHQDATLFPVWYTYDRQGNKTWYVMPGGSWTASNTYTGALYRTTGSPWVGTVYDPQRLSVIPVGTMTLTFSTSDMGTMAYSVDGVSGGQVIFRQPF